MDTPNAPMNNPTPSPHKYSHSNPNVHSNTNLDQKHPPEPLPHTPAAKHPKLFCESPNLSKAIATNTDTLIQVQTLLQTLGTQTNCHNLALESLTKCITAL